MRKQTNKQTRVFVCGIKKKLRHAETEYSSQFVFTLQRPIQRDGTPPDSYSSSHLYSLPRVRGSHVLVPRIRGGDFGTL